MQTTKKRTKALLLFIAFTFIVTFTLPQNNANAQNLSEEDLIQEAELLKVFQAIESIPDEVIEQGEEATTQWLQKNTDLVLQDGEIQIQGVVGCVSAVGTAILTNVIPWAKLAKVKDAIKAAGGATTFVKTLIPAYKEARKKNSKAQSVKIAVNKAGAKAGPEVRRALLDFFNVGNVYSSCFE